MENVIDNKNKEYIEFISKFNRTEYMDGIRDRLGKFLLRALFYETSNHAMMRNCDHKVPYTLLPYDYEYELPRNLGTHKALSLYKIYMNSTDEYDFAIKAFNSFPQFKLLLEADWFLYPDKNQKYSGFLVWREEKEMKEKSLNLQRIVEHAEMGNIQSIKLLEERYKETIPRGRPSKEEKEKYLNQRREVAQDLKNIKLRLIKSNAKENKGSTFNTKFA